MKQRRIKHLFAGAAIVGISYLNVFSLQGIKNNAATESNMTLALDQPNQECQLLDGYGNALMQHLIPRDGSVIFSLTLFGEARVSNVIRMLTELIDIGERPELPNLPHTAMIAVSGNETMIPLLYELSLIPNLASIVLIAKLAQDFGPLSRVVATDCCFSPSKDYIFVVGDDDVVYNRQAVFTELPIYLQHVQKRLNNSLAMVGYAGLHWIYPAKIWGGFLKGTQYGRHISDGTWENYRAAA